MTRPRGRRTSFAAATALTAVFSALLCLWVAAPAQAGSSCGSTGCSMTKNDSGYGVLAVRDWTCSDGTTGTRAGAGCVSMANTTWITRAQWTPLGQDWDSFQVDAGWCYKVELRTPFKTWTMYYNRIGQSTPVYVKVEDWGSAFVKAQSHLSCP